MKVLEGKSKSRADRLICPCCSAGQTFRQTTQHALRTERIKASHRHYPIEYTRMSWECEECGHAQADERQNRDCATAREMAEIEIDSRLDITVLELVGA